MEDDVYEGADMEPTEDTESTPNPKVAWWTKHVMETRKKRGKVFERMREDMEFARGKQWKGQKDVRDPEERYVANIVHRHLRQTEAALYAKNPTAVAKRRKTLDYEIWDGDLDQIQQAQQTLMQIQQMQMQMMQTGPMGAATMAPGMLEQMQQQAQEAQMLIEDYKLGTEYRKRTDRIGSTLEIVWEHQVGEQQPPFKRSMKHLVRRALTTCIGFLKLGYHRFQQYRPEDEQRVTDMTEQLARTQMLIAGAEEEGEEGYDEYSKEARDLQDALAKMQNDQTVFTREGLDFDFPQATSIIVDCKCYQLDGFLGATWVAHEFKFTAEQVEKIYGIDIKNKFTAYDLDGNEVGKAAGATGDGDDNKDGFALIWEVWDKSAEQTFTICSGHPEYLVAPKTPDVRLERFWPFFTIMFNGVEDEKEIYPPSDVELLRPMQRERNLMRQRVREHRDAARPGYVAPKGRLDEQDKTSLQSRNAHDVVELNGLTEADDIRRILQAIPSNPIDPNQYETGGLDEDIYRAVGSQEAVLGGTSGASATETSIGESARLSAIGSNVDDLDDFLTEVTKAASHILMQEMSAERVKEIAGRGAIWPDLNADQIAQDLWLEVRAGSSGRPNKAAEIQNLERLLPYLIQVPGAKPKKVLDLLIERLDDRLEVDDLYDSNLPSIISQNQAQQASTGDPTTDPNAQGGQGAGNAPAQEGDTNLGPRPPQEGRVMDPNRE